MVPEAYLLNVLCYLAGTSSGNSLDMQQVLSLDIGQDIECHYRDFRALSQSLRADALTNSFKIHPN
jgi:hypothetical protein